VRSRNCERRYRAIPMSNGCRNLAIVHASQILRVMIHRAEAASRETAEVSYCRFHILDWPRSACAGPPDRSRTCVRCRYHRVHISNRANDRGSARSRRSFHAGRDSSRDGSRSRGACPESCWCIRASRCPRCSDSHSHRGTEHRACIERAAGNTECPWRQTEPKGESSTEEQ
jgi:hypothetical protein